MLHTRDARAIPYTGSTLSPNEPNPNIPWVIWPSCGKKPSKEKRKLIDVRNIGIAPTTISTRTT